MSELEQLLHRSIELAKAKQLPTQKTATQRELERLIKQHRNLR